MKRTFDIIFSAAMLLLLSPILLLDAITARLGLGKPVLYKQQLPGMHGKHFELLKFRTMYDKCDVDGSLTFYDQRMSVLWGLLGRKVQA